MCRETGRGEGADDPAFVLIFMDDSISAEVQWYSEEARGLDLSRSLRFIYDQAMGERSEGEEPLLSRNKVTGGATQQEFSVYDIGTEGMAIALPARK